MLFACWFAMFDRFRRLSTLSSVTASGGNASAWVGSHLLRRTLVTGGALATCLLTALLAAGAGQPLPASAGEPACPDAQAYCDAMAHLYYALIDGDVDQVIAQSRPTDVVCTDGLISTARGNACNGASEGEHRQGYLIGGGGPAPIAGYGNAAAYRAFLEELIRGIHALETEPGLNGSFSALGFAVAEAGRCYFPFIGTATNPEDGHQDRSLLIVFAQVDEDSGELQILGNFVSELDDGVTPIGPGGLNAPHFVYWSPPART